MNELIQRWLQLALTWRIASLQLLALLLGLAWLLLLRPQQQQFSTLQQQLSQLAQQHQQRQQQLDARPAIEQLRAEIATLQPAATAASVSLEQLVAARGNQLEAASGQPATAAGAAPELAAISAAVQRAGCDGVSGATAFSAAGGAGRVTQRVLAGE